MAVNRGRYTRSRTERRQSLWIPLIPSTTVIAAASTATIIATLNASALALRPFTIVRTRGTLQARSDQTAGTEEYGCGFGMAVVSDQAVAIGATAIPTPVTDYGSDLWFLIEQMFGEFVLKTTVGIEGFHGVERQIDSKAMRKVEDGEDVIIVAETPLFTPSVELFSALRFLVKLH